MSFFTSVAKKLFPDAQVKGVERLVGGVSASVQRIDLELSDGKTANIVVRTHSATHSGLCAEIECQLLTALHNNGIPVALPLFVDTSRSIQANPYLVMEYIEGSSVISPEEEYTNTETMAGMLAKIHSASIASLPSLPMRIDPLLELFDYLPVGTESNKLKNHLESMSNTAYTETPKLLHGDFWPENLLWHKGRIAAVLDWEDAAFGDPLSDVACCRLELLYRFGNERKRQFTHAYIKYHTVDLERLALWQVFVASASHHFMGNWGLTQELESHMRQLALESIKEAGAVLMGE